MSRGLPVRSSAMIATVLVMCCCSDLRGAPLRNPNSASTSATTNAAQWTGNGNSSNWSDAGNWLGGVLPVSSDTTSVSITGTASAGVTTSSNQDIASPFQLNSLSVDLTGIGTFSLTGGTLGLTSTGPNSPHGLVITQNSPSAVTIGNAIGVTHLDGGVSVSGNGTGLMSLSGAIHASGLTKSGSCSLALRGLLQVDDLSFQAGDTTSSGTNYVSDRLEVGTKSGSVVSLSLTDGSITQNPAGGPPFSMFVGGAGTGMFAQSGGSVRPFYLTVGNNGSYQISGGSIDQEGTSGISIAGVFHQTGGSVTADVISVGAGGALTIEGGGVGANFSYSTNNGNMLISGTGAVALLGLFGTGTTTVTNGGRLFLWSLGNTVLQLSDPPSGGSALKVSGGGTNTVPISDAANGPGGMDVAGGLVFFNAINTYTGPTTVRKNASIGGTGRINGLVTLESGASVSPGGVSQNQVAGTLEVGSLLMLPGSTYSADLKASGSSDILEVYPEDANVSGAWLTLVADANLPLGSSFPVLTIDNGGEAKPIQGRFTNAPQAGVLEAGGNYFAVNYFGGDGNDLTLTAIPPIKLTAKSVQKSGNTVNVAIDSFAGYTYQLQRSSSLAAGLWDDVATPQTGSTNTTLVFSNPTETAAIAFYRVNARVTP